MTTTTDNTNDTQLTVENLNKKISRTIFFKDRIIDLNEKLKDGKTEKELEMSVFEIELRARAGNHNFIKLENGKFVKLFSWDLIKRSIEKIKKLRTNKLVLSGDEGKIITNA